MTIGSLKAMPASFYENPNDPDDTLRLASLFEREFSIDWLVALTGVKPSIIIASLEAAVKDGVLKSLGAGYFRFKNLKFRQKWSRQLNLESTNDQHSRIADILLREFENDETKIDIITPHLLKAKNGKEACQWLIKAGDQYLKQYRTEIAVQCYTKVIEDLLNTDGDEEDAILIESAIKYSKISTARHDTGRVADLLEEGMKRARRRNMKSSEALLQMHLAKNDWLRSKYRSALKHFEHGWRVAKGLGDPKLLRSAKTFSTFFLYWQGRFTEAVESYEKSEPQVEKYPRGGYPLLAASLVGYCYALTGQVTQGLGMLDTIRTSCLERGDEFLSAWGAFNIGKIMLDLRNIDSAIDYLEDSLRQATRTHNDFIVIHGKLVLAYAYYLKGDKKETISFLREFIKLSGQVKMKVQPYTYLMDLCSAMDGGKLPKVKELSMEGEVYKTIRNENIFLKGVAYRYKALQEIREGMDFDKIVRTLNTSIKWLKESGHLIQLSKSKLELALVMLSYGKEEKARELTCEAHDITNSFNYNFVPDELMPFVKNTDRSEVLLKEILNLGQEVVNLRNDKELVQHIISTVNRLTGAERGAIFLLEGDADNPRLRLKASKNLTSQQIEDPIFESSLKMVREVAQKSEPRILEISSGEDVNTTKENLIRSRVCLPMVFRDKVIGVLYHDNRLLSSAFKESDLDLLAYFSALATFAMENVNAYEEVRRLNQKLSEENLYYEERHLESLHFEDIVGESDAIKHVMNQAQQVAATETTVLILGETGVGKELVARAIHRNSSRGNKPFIGVQCSALPESLISSELFGHEKGAFTGANRRRLGRFELADGGTLFMDEIGDISLDVQTRLLRVLQNKEFERVGGSDTIRSDFRLIAATNSDLLKGIQEHKFRNDLYYRLSVFPINVPPLRDRKEDIALLAMHFLKVHSKRMGKPVDRIPKDEMDRLVQYDWPGNVRELENVFERGTILSKGRDFITPELGTVGQEENCHNVRSLAENERRHILWSLRTCYWKVRGRNGAAEMLEVHPSTLAFRMKKLGIQRPKGIPKRRASRLSNG